MIASAAAAVPTAGTATDAATPTPTPPAFEPTPDAWPGLRDALATAIAASATPERDDRLFPGDIEQFMSGLDDTFLRRDIQYLNSKGQLCSDPAPLVLGHFFNHQTHHRGQLHVMLSQTAVRRPNFDLHRAIRAPIGAS